MKRLESPLRLRNAFYSVVGVARKRQEASMRLAEEIRGHARLRCGMRRKCEMLIEEYLIMKRVIMAAAEMSEAFNAAGGGIVAHVLARRGRSDAEMKARQAISWHQRSAEGGGRGKSSTCEHAEHRARRRRRPVLFWRR